MSKLILVFIILLISSVGLMAQDNYPTCIHPEIINYPNLVNDENNVPNEIYYQPEDEYTFWYKLNVNADCKLFFELSTIGNDDEYDMMIYRYNGKNICNDIVQNQESPLLNKIKGELNVKKDESYYLSVLHLNGIGCGHILSLTNQNNTTIIKAIHHDCIEDAIESIIEQDSFVETSLNPVVEKIELLDTLENTDDKLKINNLKGIVVNKNTQKQLEAELSILNLSGILLNNIKSDINDGFRISNINDSEVVVLINKFGYEPYNDTINVVENEIKIELCPIKVGEKIVMHKIYFHPNTYVLKKESTNELLKLNKFMLENSQYLFEIQGHTNGNKSVKKTTKYAHLGEEWNFTGSAKKLSKLRAEKIKEYLVENGVLEAQIQTIGYGGDRMIVEKPKNMKQAMQNIRVEIIVIK